jgi:hypothetical protein
MARANRLDGVGGDGGVFHLIAAFLRLVIPRVSRHGVAVPTKAKKPQTLNDRAARIYRRLQGARGCDDDELWQHALFFAMSPEQRCQFSLKTARSALSLKRSARKA